MEETAAYPTVLECGVVRAVVRELPSEERLEERAGFLQVARRNFDVVDGVGFGGGHGERIRMRLRCR